MNNINSTNTYSAWDEIARDNQKIPEGDWNLWMILAGRGFGKTRTGAESVMKLVQTGEYKRIAIIGKNVKEVRDIMIEGQSGILSTSYASNTPETYDDGEFQTKRNCKYYPSKKQIVWENGARAYIVGADNYESLRGLQFDLVWVDEFAKFKDPEAVWDQIMFTLRLGENPRCIMTTTPKPLSILRNLSEHPKTYMTKGSTFENSINLSARFLDTMQATYVNTQIGDQELFGEILLTDQNTLWKKENIIYKEIDRGRIERVVIGVDPAVTNSDSSDETGIIVAGLGYDGNMYVLDDLSGKYTVQDWAKVVGRAYMDYEASCVVAETNNGGDLVREMLKTVYPYIPFKETKAIKGKVARAEPIAMLYESNMIFHSKRFKDLEDQMCSLSYKEKIKKSPDRVDALVWAIGNIKERNICSISSIVF